MNEREMKGIALALLTAGISGVSIVVNKIGLKGINPFLYTGLKNVLVALFFTLLLVLLKEWKVMRTFSRKQWFLLVVIGVFGGGIPFLLFFKGLSLTTASSASLIQKSMFLFVAVLAPLVLSEKLEKRFFLGAVFLMSGAIISANVFPLTIHSGDWFILLAMLFWATEVVLVKKVMSSISPRVVAWARMFFGSVFITGFLIATGQMESITRLSATNIAWIVITSLFLVLYILTWFVGLKYARATIVTTVLTLGGPISVGLSTFIWGKAPGLYEVAGLGLVTIGILLTLGLSTLVRLKEVFRFGYAPLKK